MNTKLQDFRVIDLFSGAGAMSHGFSKYFPVIAGIDIAEDPIKSFELNHTMANPIHDDIINCEFAKKDTEILTAVIGGSPCQDFSDANKNRDTKSDRANLIFEFIRVAKQVQPDFMVIENVQKVPKKMKKELIKGLEELDYKVTSQIVNAHEFGSVQKRPRWITTAGKNKHFYPISNRNGKIAADILEPDTESEFGIYKSTLEKFKHLRQGVWDSLPGQDYNAYYVVDPDKPLPVVANPNKLRYIKPDRSGYLSKSELRKAFGLPESFKIYSTNDSLSSWGQQVANMVPIEVGNAFAKSIYEVIV